MKLVRINEIINIIMLPNTGEQAMFYMADPMACRTRNGLWYRVHRTGSLIVDGHLETYLKAHMGVMHWCEQEEMNAMVACFGGDNKISERKL